MRGLAEHTDRTDHATEKTQADRVGVGLTGSAMLPVRMPTHRELVVTEGRKAVIVPPLQGQDHLDRLIIRLRLNVLESFGVAPQFVGESVSAERVGSNAQSTSKASLPSWPRSPSRVVRQPPPLTASPAGHGDVPAARADLARPASG